MNTAGQLTGRVAIVTGAGSGIGRAAAEVFSERGAAVIAADRDAVGAETTATAIRSLGGVAIGVEADVSEEADVDRFVSDTVAELGRIDFLFANAAVHCFGDVVETSPRVWDEQMGVNLRGVYLCARACLPHMIHAGGGAIVATSSDCVVRTCAQSAAYVAAKAGVIALMRSIAVDFGNVSVRANTVVPGVTDTPGLRRAYSTDGRIAAEGIERAAALSPLGRIGSPRDIAEAVAFLCSDQAAFVTGATLLVDGGMTITYGAD